MNLSKTLVLYLLFIVQTSTFGWANDNGEQKFLLKDDLYQFELKTQPGAKKIYLTTIGAREPLPDEISVTLFDSQNTGRTILLQVLKSASGGGGANSGLKSRETLPQFQGRLDPGVGSYVGIELKISSGSDRMPRIIRWQR